MARVRRSDAMKDAIDASDIDNNEIYADACRMSKSIDAYVGKLIWKAYKSEEKNEKSALLDCENVSILTAFCSSKENGDRLMEAYSHICRTKGSKEKVINLLISELVASPRRYIKDSLDSFKNRHLVVDLPDMANNMGESAANSVVSGMSGNQFSSLLDIYSFLNTRFISNKSLEYLPGKFSLDPQFEFMDKAKHLFDLLDKYVAKEDKRGRYLEILAEDCSSIMTFCDPFEYLPMMDLCINNVIPALNLNWFDLDMLSNANNESTMAGYLLPVFSLHLAVKEHDLDAIEKLGLEKKHAARLVASGIVSSDYFPFWDLRREVLREKSVNDFTL